MKINEMFDLERDKYQWILTTKTPSIGKKKQAIVSRKDTYHQNLHQVAEYILHTYALDMTELNALVSVFNSAADDIAISLNTYTPQFTI